MQIIFRLFECLQAVLRTHSAEPRVYFHVTSCFYLDYVQRPQQGKNLECWAQRGDDHYSDKRMHHFEESGAFENIINCYATRFSSGLI